MATHDCDTETSSFEKIIIIELPQGAILLWQ